MPHCGLKLGGTTLSTRLEVLFRKRVPLGMSVQRFLYYDVFKSGFEFLYIIVLYCTIGSLLMKFFPNGSLHS